MEKEYSVCLVRIVVEGTPEYAKTEADVAVSSLIDRGLSPLDYRATAVLGDVVPATLEDKKALIDDMRYAEEEDQEFDDDLDN